MPLIEYGPARSAPSSPRAQPVQLQMTSLERAPPLTQMLQSAAGGSETSSSSAARRVPVKQLIEQFDASQQAAHTSGHCVLDNAAAQEGVTAHVLQDSPPDHTMVDSSRAALEQMFGDADVDEWRHWMDAARDQPAAEAPQIANAIVPSADTFSDEPTDVVGLQVLVSSLRKQIDGLVSVNTP